MHGVLKKKKTYPCLFCLENLRHYYHFVRAKSIDEKERSTVGILKKKYETIACVYKMGNLPNESEIR